MSYNISSDSFQHPLLKPIMEQLASYFSELDVKFYVIGATARDIIMNIHNEKAGRATLDLDIAIAISNWDEYKNIEEGLVKLDGFEKDKSQSQRFIYHKEFDLDIIPFGDIMKEDDKIFWPPDEDVAMSVLGFNEVGAAAERVKIDKEITINVASLAGISILKIIAWADRWDLSNKDANDIGFIINNYLSINQQRAVEQYYDEIYTDDFSINAAGAFLLGIDMAEILKEKSKRSKIISIIEKEVDKKTESPLINQIIETNNYFKYEDTFNCLLNIIKGLNR